MTERTARRGERVPSWLIGLVLFGVLAVASLLAFTKELPWGDSYEVRAVFSSAQSVRTSAPVRIAGVNVGKVTKVEPLTTAEAASETEGSGGQAAVVTMELSEDARPIRADATFKLRPRLFLEGNYFVDLQPGSPNADEVPDGHTFPVNQTAYSVQLDQVLTTLQSDVRADLRVLLDQFGNALIEHGGAAGFRELYRTSPASYKFTSQVNEALLGTEPGDLSGLVANLDRVVRGLGRNEVALQGLVTNLRVVSGSFAADDVALSRAIEELPAVLDSANTAFVSLNDSFPAVRAFAREALPGTRSAPATLDEALPFIDQVRALVSQRELRGLVADLRPTVPDLARLTRESLGFMEQVRALSSCFNEVVIPWSNDTVGVQDPLGVYPHPPTGRVFEETGYGLAGLNGESRSGDANSPWIRVRGGGGTNTVHIPGTAGREDAFGVVPFEILGAAPKLTDSAKTPFRPNQPCERQEAPDLTATVGAPPEQSSAAAPTPDNLPPQMAQALARFETLTRRYEQVEDARAAGQMAHARRLEREIAADHGRLLDAYEESVGALGAER